MKVLLDTCVLSELRRSDGNPRVRMTIENYPDSDLFISVLSLGEIIKGIALLAPGKKKEGLQRWVQGIEQNYADRICQLMARRAASGARLLPRRVRKESPCPQLMA